MESNLIAITEKQKYRAKSERFIMLTGVMIAAAFWTHIGAKEMANEISPDIYNAAIPGMVLMAVVAQAGVVGAFVNKVLEQITSNEETRPLKKRLIDKMLSLRGENEQSPQQSSKSSL